MTQGCRIIKKPDNDIVLDYTKWTKEDWRISFVMNMWITKSDTQMREFCTELMKICEKYDSTFYLPYRLSFYLTGEQIIKIYPKLHEFVEKKKEIDPNNILYSRFYQKIEKTINSNCDKK